MRINNLNAKYFHEFPLIYINQNLVMMIKNNLLPIFLMFFFIVFSCSNDDDTAPPITAENTFSCKINGKLFIPKDHGGFPVILDGTSVNLAQNNSWRFIFGNRSTDVYIYLHEVEKTGSYSLSTSEGRGDFFQKNENLIELDLSPWDSNIEHISTLESGEIEVLELEVNKRIVLEFDKITLVNKDDASDKVVLTEGKLNINLETLYGEKN
ncbi:hypothetical protein [Joostella sp. CR20]|uniref:hypothetical protein n=1 Tax=Joostella sp. CR20 TaxID=2804312 RepID=UPI00313DC744